MKQVEYFRWWVTAPGRRKPYLTAFPMDADTAAAQYPGAKPDPSTRQVRRVPDTDAEKLQAMMHYQSAGHDSVKPPVT
jgi:hypothetical protein